MKSSPADQARACEHDSAAHMSREQIAECVHQKIRYVFVIYQENRSFDSYFGTFPGADGLFSQPVDKTPGFYQPLVDTNGQWITIQPFRIGPDVHPCGRVSDCFAADTADVDHSHPGILSKMDIQDGSPNMDHFALAEEKYEMKRGYRDKPSLADKQFGELTMAYEDCDTIPLLWRYASRFVLFDHIFQLMTGPSTPGNLSIIGAQTGVTQWIRSPKNAYPGDGNESPGVPVMEDDDPFWGSPRDPWRDTNKMPRNPWDYAKSNRQPYGTAINLTYATLPLTLLGGTAANVMSQRNDPRAETDLADVKEDVQFLTYLKQASVAFRWYQEGYHKEPIESDCPPDQDAKGEYASYITHHNGPQYFGYIANNPKMGQDLYGLQNFLDDVQNRALPVNGGVFFIKGGCRNILGLNPDEGNFLGDDDHPGYSDAQISEAMVATVINKIVWSPYWKHCAIIITWDDSEGDYDHVPPPLRVKGPDGSFISNGPRVPLILISPYARKHYLAHAEGNHASVVKFIDTVFQLPPLAILPDEFSARLIGEQKYGQTGLGPEDALTPGVTDLLDAFSADRLRGVKPLLSRHYAFIPWNLVRQLPAETSPRYGCRALCITTTDRSTGYHYGPPADFNPRPKTDPSK
ncbi:MAG TPA: alkaline phosphatase family protein [Candidatus Acidoferrales bacterium]|nr:alkaline phosphatase family protein [Candidatus Acidoferrales bacterium]